MICSLDDVRSCLSIMVTCPIFAWLLWLLRTERHESGIYPPLIIHLWVILDSNTSAVTFQTVRTTIAPNGVSFRSLLKRSYVAVSNIGFPSVMEATSLKKIIYNSKWFQLGPICCFELILLWVGDTEVRLFLYNNFKWVDFRKHKITINQTCKENFLPLPWLQMQDGDFLDRMPKNW